MNVFVDKRGIVHATADAPRKDKPTCSKRLAYGVLFFDAAATGYCLLLCTLAIWRDFTGSLPFLTALIAFLQAMTGVVLNAYFSKAKAENTRGGIVYDAAMAANNEEGRTI